MHDALLFSGSSMVRWYISIKDASDPNVFLPAGHHAAQMVSRAWVKKTPYQEPLEPLFRLEDRDFLAWQLQQSAAMLVLVQPPFRDSLT